MAAGFLWTTQAGKLAWSPHTKKKKPKKNKEQTHALQQIVRKQCLDCRQHLSALPVTMQVEIYCLMQHVSVGSQGKNNWHDLFYDEGPQDFVDLSLDSMYFPFQQPQTSWDRRSSTWKRDWLVRYQAVSLAEEGYGRPVSFQAFS